MMQPSPQSAVREAAEAEITKRRSALLRERRDLRLQMERFAERDRAIERELIECHAAGKFFGIEFYSPEEEEKLQEIRTRIEHYGLLVRTAVRKGEKARADYYRARLVDWERRLREIEEGKARENNQKRLPIDGPDADLSDENKSRRSKLPKISEIALDMLKSAAPEGLRAAQIRAYVERNYAVQIHEKTVGMTLYRLLKREKVHRKKQVWFFGPQAEPSLPAIPENPGVGSAGAHSES